MARLGKRERAQKRAIAQARKARNDRVDFSFTINTSTMRAKYWESYSGRVCQNFKGSHEKYKASDCLFDKIQALKV